MILSKINLLLRKVDDIDTKLTLSIEKTVAMPEEFGEVNDEIRSLLPLRSEDSVDILERMLSDEPGFFKKMVAYYCIRY